MPSKDIVRVAAVGDMHLTRTGQGTLQPLFAQIADTADILLVCGDLTSLGLPEEAQVLARELAPASRIPILVVFGNHEYESGQAAEVRRIIEAAGAIVLDGDAIELAGIGFAGVKGFGGGFGQHALEPWGEQALKLFVKEAVDEVLKLESALARIRTPRRIAVLHYAPIRATVEGEPAEIWPFLGSSRLEEPLNRYQVTAVFHGHAHNGQPVGATLSGVPVFNVAMPLLRKTTPERPPFRIFDVAVAAEPAFGPVVTPADLPDRRTADATA